MPGHKREYYLYLDTRVFVFSIWEDVMNRITGRHIRLLAVFLVVGTLTACAGKVGQKTFDREMQQVRSSLEEHDERLEKQNARISDNTAQLRALEQELQGLRNNFQAKITKLAQGLRFTLPVHFEFDRAQVRAVDRPLLDRFAGIVKKHYPNALITIEGFADPAGSKAYNIQLSKKRASSVKKYLVQKGGLDGQRLKAVGYGESAQRLVQPSAQGPGQEGLSNRRVTFVVEHSPDALR